MSKKKEIGRCKQFLFENGWKLNNEEYDPGWSFWKEGSIGIDITKEGDMAFIGEEGDFLHKEVDYYTLVGVLLEYRQLPINYNSVSL